MKASYRLLAVAALAGLCLFRMASFEKNAQEQYLQFMAAGRAAAAGDTTGSSREGVCQILPSQTSALALWTQHISQIHGASQLLPMDPDYEFQDLTAQLLHLLSPRLPNSVKAIPREWESVQHVLEKVLLPRWNYLQKSAAGSVKVPPRPVKIVVMGGSVVAGINCLQVFAKKVRHKLTREQCAWPFRLQQFLDRMVGVEPTDTTKRLFEVHTVVMGGSNTISGNAILEFDLLPPEAKNPDIIINAYATNDMHLSTFHQGQQTDSWREKAMTVLQDFIRLAHDSTSGSSCTTENRQHYYPPVVLHLDDYLGNEQREILATTELSQAVHILSSYYGTLTAMSYADIVRDWVYGDTKEFWFSPFEWYPPYKLNKLQMKREIHPSMPMHMAVPWIVSYNLLNLLVHCCDRQPYHHEPYLLQEPRIPFGQLPKAQKIYDHEYELARTQRGLLLPPLKGDVRLPGKPHVTPYGLPPPLTPDLSLQDVSALWRNQSLALEYKKPTDCTSLSEQPKCPFAWVSGLLSGHNALDENQVEGYFQQHSLQYYNQGWQVRRHVDGKKMGFVPAVEQPGANLTMVFDERSGAIAQVVLFYLKSYGEKWDHSRLRLQLQAQSGNNLQPLVSRELVGFHAKNTSEMYIERIKLPHAADRLRLEATFVGGKVFKIMGLLVCR